MARSRDIDEVLRRMAAQDQLTEHDSKRGWARVRQGAEDARRARPRHRRLLLATSLGLLLIGVMTWQSVGTEDFTLVSEGPDDLGHSVFNHRHRQYSASMYSDSLSVEDMQHMSEEILAASEAGNYKLLSVRGTTIKGKTHLIAVAEVQTSYGPQVTNADVDITMNEQMTEDSANTVSRFMLTRYAETAKAIKDGRATSVGPIDVVAGGRVFRCDRWQFFYPEFGTVIYWVGLPSP